MSLVSERQSDFSPTLHFQKSLSRKKRVSGPGFMRPSLSLLSTAKADSQTVYGGAFSWALRCCAAGFGGTSLAGSLLSPLVVTLSVSFVFLH